MSSNKEEIHTIQYTKKTLLNKINMNNDTVIVFDMSTLRVTEMFTPAHSWLPQQ